MNAPLRPPAGRGGVGAGAALRRGLSLAAGLLALGSILGGPSSSSAADAALTGGDAPVEAKGTTPQPSPKAKAAAAASDGSSVPLPRTRRRKAPPLAPPSEAQLRALAELHAQAAVYEAGAKDYRSAVSRIVRAHFEERQRRILAALDSEIAAEEKSLRDAQQDVIRRLEDFVARYQGPRAKEKETPDAMFRLAALYEERADTEDGTQSRQKAAHLYEKIIASFPRYGELAAVYYYLGHAYQDLGRLPEAQHVWRSLVCKNHYPYPTAPDPKDPSRWSVPPMVQDHDQAYWDAWENRHPQPLDRDTRSVNGAGNPGEVAGAPDEVSFRDPYPSDCVSRAQPTAPGAEPRYVAEVWWRLGEYHFNRMDVAGGPFNLNRAESALRHSLEFKKPPVHGVAMYKLAWTYFEQQRYEASVRKFIELLRYTDAEEKRTGEAGTDFRTEAYSYIASALTYDDFVGPPAANPDIPRSDSQDTEEVGPQLEAKKRVAIERLQNPKIIPQNERWTVDLYKAMAKEFDDVKQLRNSISVSELLLERWPNDRDAPQVRVRVADAYDALAALARPDSAEKSAYAERALQERTRLSEYIGTSPWVDANKDDPEAIRQAEILVRTGLKRAAADHTNEGLAAHERAQTLSDPQAKLTSLNRALAEFRRAAVAWESYVEQDENAIDAYESRFWLAHARHEAVSIVVESQQSPSAEEFESAVQAALEVRESNDDDKRMEVAAFFVVDLAYLQRQDAGRRWAASQGADGAEFVDKLRQTEPGKYTVLPVPAVAQAYVERLDEFGAEVPAQLDVNNRTDGYRFEAAYLYFHHGQFDEARRRFQPIYEEFCGKSPLGYRAWNRLVVMANLQGDIPASRKLAEAALKRSCATNEEERIAERDLAKPTVALGYYLDAEAAIAKAEETRGEPARTQAWRQAGALSKLALEKIPDHERAPETAINGAYAYRQAGEFDQAIELYELFIDKFANEATLTLLEKGDPKATPPKAADPKRYGTRLGLLLNARQQLAASYVLFFNYEAAARAYETIARYARFEGPVRRDAASRAALLVQAMGDQGRLGSLRGLLADLKASQEELARLDFSLVSAPLKLWNPQGADEGENRKARLRAIESLEGYYTRNVAPTALTAGYAVQAAYHLSQLRKPERDKVPSEEWCFKTMAAFQRYLDSTKEPDKVRGTDEARLAAECRFMQIDAVLKREFDYEAGHHRYTGSFDKVLGDFDADLAKAEPYVQQLQDVTKVYGPTPWTIAAIARQGTVYDSCREGLYRSTPEVVPPKLEKMLDDANADGNDALAERLEAGITKLQQGWKNGRQQRFDKVDPAILSSYAQAVTLAKATEVKNTRAQEALGRLAFYTDLLGDAKMAGHLKDVKDRTAPDGKLQYEDGLFLRSRPGLLPELTTRVEAMPSPLSVEAPAPQTEVAP